MIRLPAATLSLVVALSVTTASAQTCFMPLWQPSLAGEQSVSWDGADDRGRRLPSGVYMLRIEVEGTETRTERNAMLR